MSAFYEYFRDSDNNLVIVGSGDKNYVYPSHFHRRIELFLLKKGSYRVIVNKNSYTISSGDVLFLDSFAVHSYESPLTDDLDALCVLIPRDYAINFFSRHNGKVINPIISDKHLTEKLYLLIKEYLIPNFSDNVKKGATELIFSMLEDKLTFSENKENTENTTILDMLLYIEKNLTKNLSLSSIAKALGYSPAHLSRTFKKYVNSSLPEYLNKLRLEKVEELIKQKNVKKSQAIFDAGFNSFQTYYRVKSKSQK